MSSRTSRIFGDIGVGDMALGVDDIDVGMYDVAVDRASHFDFMVAPPRRAA